MKKRNIQILSAFTATLLCGSAFAQVVDTTVAKPVSTDTSAAIVTDTASAVADSAATQGTATPPQAFNIHKSQQLNNTVTYTAFHMNAITNEMLNSKVYGLKNEENTEA